MRKVCIYEWKRVEGKRHYEKVSIGNGLFHQFGVGYEELDAGVGNFSTAIVELLDGSIVNVPVDLITFNN